MTTAPTLPSSRWSRLSPGLHVVVIGGGVYVAPLAASNRLSLTPLASVRTSATSSSMHFADFSIDQS